MKIKYRRKLDKLTNNELENLISNFTLDEIAINFDISKSSIQAVYKSRGMFKGNSPRFIHDEFSSEDYIKSYNAWMNSKERLYLQTINKQ
jgi:hypothetical protein